MDGNVEVEEICIRKGEWGGRYYHLKILRVRYDFISYPIGCSSNTTQEFLDDWGRERDTI
jgi:hypothetical protein